MYRRALFIYTAFLLFQVFIIGCCPAPNNIYHYIDNIKITNTDLQEIVPDSAVVKRKNYRIKCDFDTQKKVAYRPNKSAFFIQTALASSCEDNYRGFKFDIVRFEVRCNKDILGIPAGAPLDYSKFRVYKTTFFDDVDNSRETIPSWLNILNNGDYKLGFEWYFEFVEKIESTEFLKFELLFEFENGEFYKMETDYVKLE